MVCGCQVILLNEDVMMMWWWLCVVRQARRCHHIYRIVHTCRWCHWWFEKIRLRYIYWFNIRIMYIVYADDKFLSLAVVLVYSRWWMSVFNVANYRISALIQLKAIIQGGAKIGATISLQIFWKFHERIAWKLVYFCNIIYAEHSHVRLAIIVTRK